jgi:hypothetical protein
MGTDMREKRVYVLRQCLLDGASDLDGLPFSLDDIAAFPGLRALKPTREELQQTWCELCAYGFLAEVPESDRQYARITAAGLAQSPRRLEGARDVRIWGPQAF